MNCEVCGAVILHPDPQGMMWLAQVMPSPIPLALIKDKSFCSAECLEKFAAKHKE